MRRTLAGLSVAVVLLLPSLSHSCGDKFLVSGRGPNLASIHRPPRPLAILIYGNDNSPAIAAVSSENYSSTLSMVGHNVTKCDNPKDCEALLAGGKFDVVLADPGDAANLKGTIGSAVLPVTMKPTKEALGKIKADYAVVFDASRDALRLLPLLIKATKVAR